jgi:hypothetical protein
LPARIPVLLPLLRADVDRCDGVERRLYRLTLRRDELNRALGAFGLTEEERHFARRLLHEHSRFHLFRCHQQARCGDFVAVDCSAPEPALRAILVIELKHRAPLKVERPGLQMSGSAALSPHLAARGLVEPGAPRLHLMGGEEEVTEALRAWQRLRAA